MFLMLCIFQLIGRSRRGFAAFSLSFGPDNTQVARVKNLNFSFETQYQPYYVV